MNMKLSLSTLILVFFIIFISVFIANLSNIISIHVENSFVSDRDADARSASGPPNGSKIVIGRTQNNLMWFVQISDLHISIFHEQSRTEQLRDFCSTTIPAIKPSVVLASGDLTDAKSADNIGSTQQLDEWHIYQKILNDTNVNNKTLWLDIRGNHDNFNIPDEQSHLNYYRVYSVQGVDHPHSYIHITDLNGVRYAFLGIDACLNPGPKRPFNFVGMLTANETKHIKRLINLAQGSGVQYTITFGHYPTSCILGQPQTPLRKLLLESPGAWVYLCGHFHMFGGLIPNMYTLQQTGLLELELADWKDNRMYRIAAIDHGMFSFIDVAYDQWPAILITNPKHGLYMVPGKESTATILRSTHIRVLVFSTMPIEIVQISIDESIWWQAERVPGPAPLYVLPWDPIEYSAGVHVLHVRARDSLTREAGVSQPFSLDGTKFTFNILPRVALMSNISTLFQSLFSLAVCLSVVPLIVIRILHSLVMKSKMGKPQIRNRLLRRWITQLWILSSIDRFFYPLVIYPLYLSVGPWTIGEVIDGHIGAIFAWGLLVNNSYLPGSFTYAYGFLHICCFQLPLTLILAHDIERRLNRTDRFEFRTTRCLHHIPFFILMIIQIAGAYFFWLAYGTMALFIGPLRTWSIFLALYLWYSANTLPTSSYREVRALWEHNRSVNDRFVN